MRRHHRTPLRPQPQLLRRAPVHARMGFVRPKVLGGEHARELQASEPRQIGQQRRVPVRQGRGLERVACQEFEAARRIRPRREAVPDPRHGQQLRRVPEAVEAPFGEEGGQAEQVVRVDVDEV